MSPAPEHGVRCAEHETRDENLRLRLESGLRGSPATALPLLQRGLPIQQSKLAGDLAAAAAPVDTSPPARPNALQALPLQPLPLQAPPVGTPSDTDSRQPTPQPMASQPPPAEQVGYGRGPAPPLTGEVVKVPEFLWDHFQSSYLPQLRRDLEAMRELLAKNELAAVRATAHRIKGSALTFGLKRVHFATERMMSPSTTAEELAVQLPVIDSVINGALFEPDASVEL